MDRRKLKRHLAQPRTKGHQSWKEKVHLRQFLFFLQLGNTVEEAERKSLRKQDKTERLEKEAGGVNKIQMANEGSAEHNSRESRLRK